MKTFLFQGDSVTDAIRRRDNDAGLGNGYATVTAGMLSAAHEGKFKFINRGVSGNRIVDMYARIKADVINLKPDYLSVLIGVNDVWHEFAYQNGVDAQKYETIYKMFIDEIKAALPDIKIIILEPFVLKGTSTEGNFEEFKKEVIIRAEKARSIADYYNLPFVSLQKDLEALAEKTSNDYVLYDGVHPAVAGHALIANKLFKAVETIL